MEPWQSWAAVIVFTAIAYYYYSTQTDSRVRAQRASGRPIRGQDLKDRRKGDTNTGDATGLTDIISSDGGSGDASKRRKPAKKPATQSKLAQAPLAPQNGTSVAKRDDSEDQEWAAQLASLKKGSSLTAPPSSEKKLKTIRQSGAELSSTSSTAGADADDDLSPALSPALGATSNTASNGNGVSDMLEPAAPGPSVLRLTEAANPKVSKPSKQQNAAAAQVETKKQRQNKKKVEEQKAVREEQEKERRALMEKQRRAAREARGEPAKDGTQSARAPSSNAWAAKAVSGAPVASVGPTDGFLDTFDPQNDSQITQAPAQARAPAGDPNWGGLPSEEEQMRMAMEDSGWNTVPKGRKGKKKTGAGAGDTTGNESSDTGATASKSAVNEKEAPASNPVNEPPKLNGGSIYEHIAHPQDSDWAVV